MSKPLQFGKFSLFLLCTLYLTQGSAQNRSNNPWLIWLPEYASGTTGDAPSAAFSINAQNKRLTDVVGSPTTNKANSYAIGEDSRGYVLYDDMGARMIRVIEPRTQSVVSTFNYSSLPQIGFICSFQSFFIAAGAKYYVAIASLTAAANQGSIAILDVTNINAIALVKYVPINGLSKQYSGTVPGQQPLRATGMEVHQTTYNSAGITMFVVFDDAVKSGSNINLGIPGVSGSNFHPGVVVKITDPLAASPSVNIIETYYDATHFLAPKGVNQSAGPHQIRYDPSANNIYVASENYTKILSFNATTGAPTNNVYVDNGAVTGNTTGGFHGIFASRSGTELYAGRSNPGVAGADRAFKFTIAASAATPALITPTAVSPELSTTSNPNIKGVNLTPDEQYLYALNENGPGRVTFLNKSDMSILQVAQNKGASGNAVFASLDPHSYAFTLNDFGDLPLSYGTAGHNLSNYNYVDDLLRIGATVDGDTLGRFTNDALGDDNAQNPKTDDEDGITTAHMQAAKGLYAGMTGTFSISNILVRNETANSADLVGWIDFNHDGKFQSNEGTAVNLPVGSTSANLTWTIPGSVTSGKTVLRLRLSTDLNLGMGTPTGVILDGETEDHIFTSSLQVRGNVFNDLDGNTLKEVAEAGTNGGTSLYAYLLIDGTIADSAFVKPDGSFTFPFPPQNAGAASVVVGSNGLAPGTSASSINNIATHPPAGYVFTGSSTGSSSNGTLGSIAFTLGTAPVTNLNFGIEQPPLAMSSVLPSQPNPGGTDDIAIPATAFNTSDPNGGVVTSIQITAMPSGATSITVDGTVYTTANFPTGGITVPTDPATGQPTAAIAIDPAEEGAVSVSIPYVAVDAAGQKSAPATVTVSFDALTVSGNVFNDLNGLENNIIDGAATNAGGVNVVLIDNESEKVVAVVPVAQDGTYSFAGLNEGDYSILLTTDNPATGSPAPVSPGLPEGWSATGEGTSADGDGIIDGKVNLGQVTVDVVNANFGIEQPPIAADETAPSQPNPGGTNNATVPAAAFGATDPNGGVVSSIRITALPSGATSITINGTFYNAGTFPVEGLNVPTNSVGQPTHAILVDPATEGVTSIVIPYIATDAAGLESAPATVTVPLGSISISGNLFDDADGLEDSSIDGTPTDAGGINAVLIDNAGDNVIAIVPVAPDGTYNFHGIAPGNYNIMITTANPAPGTSAPAAAELPNGWIGTGEGTALSGDGTADGKILLGNVASNVVNANFGIDQLPASDNKEGRLAAQPSTDEFIALDGSVVDVPALSGSDPEDNPVSSTLNGKKIAITKLPANGELWYVGTRITLGADGMNPPSASNPFIIDELDATALQFKLTGSGYTNMVFEYSYIDGAGKADPTAASYTLSWEDPLPVTLMYFEASVESNQVKTNWKTSSERDFGRFEIQYSNNGREFVKLGDVKGGNPLGQYSFIYSQNDLTGYYRLKMIDADGSYAFSKILSIDLEKAPVIVFPNPTAGVAQLKGCTAGDMIRVFDQNGILILNKTVSGTSSEINLELYPNGLYLIERIDKSGVKTRLKLLKRNK